MHSIKIFIVFIFFFTTSCFIGPVKELGYQIEDAYEDESINISSPEPLKDIQNHHSFSFKWDTNISELKSSHLKPFVHQNNLFLINSDGQLFLFDLVSGKLIWEIDTESPPLAGLNGDEGSFFFVDNSGYLNSFSHAGKINWKTFVGEVLASPISDMSNVYIKTTSNTFIALNVIDGSIKWKYQAPSPPLVIRSWAKPVIGSNNIYAGISSGKVMSLDKNQGLLVWETTFSEPKGVSEIERANDTTSSPVYDENIIYTVSSKGHIAALSALNGEIYWKRPFSSFEGIVADKKTLFSIHNSGSIYSFNKNDGKVLWSNFELKGRDLKALMLNDNLILVTDYEGYLHILDSATGDILSRTRLAKGPIIFAKKNPNEKNNLIFLSKSGDLISLNFIYDGKVNLKKSSNEDKNITDDKGTLLDNLFFWE